MPWDSEHDHVALDEEAAPGHAHAVTACPVKTRSPGSRVQIEDR